MQLSPKLKIGRGPHGDAVIAESDIATNERLLRLIGKVVSEPSKYTLQRGDGEHLLPQGAAWAFLNHACDPNSAIDYDSWELVARRSIPAGEEITFNYLSTEWSLATPFVCGCGAGTCAGEIRGFRHLNAAQRKVLGPLLSPFLAANADVEGNG